MRVGVGVLVRSWRQFWFARTHVDEPERSSDVDEDVVSVRVAVLLRAQRLHVQQPARALVRLKGATRRRGVGGEGGVRWAGRRERETELICTTQLGVKVGWEDEGRGVVKMWGGEGGRRGKKETEVSVRETGMWWIERLKKKPQRKSREEQLVDVTKWQNDTVSHRINLCYDLPCE
eukprot:132513-Pleurochrysis_carterae.AAC.2